MIATHKLKIDLGYRGQAPRIDAAQDDSISRNLALSLHMNGEVWTPGEDVRAIINYDKPDHTKGSYTALPDDAPAWTLAGNLLTITLAPQVCTAPGLVKLAVSLIRGAAQITTFPIELFVHQTPGLQVSSEDYYNFTGILPTAGWTPHSLLGTDAQGSVTAVSTDPTLSLSGAAADAAAVGQHLAAAVTAVNGRTPDESGNVTIQADGLPMPAAAHVGQFFRVKEVDDAGRVSALETVSIGLGDPVAYLYGDQQTPPVPAWDMEKYPYAVVTMVTLMGKPYQIGFIVLSELTVSQDDSGMDIISYTKDSMMSAYIYLSGSNKSSEWSALTAPVSDGDILLSNVKWTNTDILRPDGSLYLAASDPVPVYDGTTAGATGSGGGGLDVIEMTTPLKYQYNSGQYDPVTDEEAAAASAALAKKMPIIIHGLIEDEENDLSVDVCDVATYIKIDGMIEGFSMANQTFCIGLVYFAETDTWMARVN